MLLDKNKVRRFSPHVFHSLRPHPFDLHAYSRMKFGSDQDARLLGHELADLFMAEHYRTLVDQRCLVIPAPSTSVPVAATLMGWHFHNRLNGILDRAGCQPVEWDLVHRAITYNDNYAQLGIAERRKLLEDDERYMNTAFAEGKTLIFVDDVRVTGTHEEKMIQMVERLGLPNEMIFCTYAEYHGDSPGIEHELNHTFVTNARVVAQMAQEPDWRVTTRALRIILETPEEEFGALLAAFSHKDVEKIYHASIVKAYNQHEPYARNFASLREMMDRLEVGGGPAAG